MTSKERMLTALRRQKPDRLPATIHQWQWYHLNKYMNGMDQVEAFRVTGLDAAVTPFDVVSLAESPNWQVSHQLVTLPDGIKGTRYVAKTPDRDLTWVAVADEYTVFQYEHIIKDQADAEAFVKYYPDWRLDKNKLSDWYDRLGDGGILRGFVWTAQQPGSWQELCELAGTEKAIMWAMDDPAFVHQFLQAMTERKVKYVHEQMPGARYDLIEHGGGAASCTVISPAMFDEFCVPYDKQVIDALHQHGFKSVYHTCGGMKAILSRIPANGTDASETLSPPGVGGDLKGADRDLAREVLLGAKVALIGGIDQGAILTNGTPQQVRNEVHACFETYGKNGGYICSASDHFFHAPAENLKAMAHAAAECRY